MDEEIPFRITVVDPPAGVQFRLQRGKADLDLPTLVSDGRLSFDFKLRVKGHREDGGPRLVGACAQGPPTGRFVYINSGTSAGQMGSCWTRRAKVGLSAVSWEWIERVLASPDAVLEARIGGTARDGGPACATVPLLDGGWKLSR